MNGFPAYVLAGPTGTGKTAVAQRLAEREGLDVLSADSMLVYRGMDIGTAKPGAAERGRVRYWGLDLADAGESFSLALWLEAARVAVRTCRAERRGLLVVGGTGLYLKALIEGLAPVPPAQPELRRACETLLASDGIGALQARLREKNPALYASLRDPQNARRLIRALELDASGWHARPSDWRTDNPAAAAVTGLRWPAAALGERLAQRVEAMYEDGLLEETRRLCERGLAGAPAVNRAIGYAEAIACLRGACTREDAMARTLVRTRQLAKRQMTWFRHQLRVEWVEGRPGLGEAALADAVWATLTRTGPVPICVEAHTP